MSRVLEISPQSSSVRRSTSKSRSTSKTCSDSKDAKKSRSRTTIAQLETQLATLKQHIEAAPVLTLQGRVAAWALGIIMPVFSVGFTAIAGLLAAADRPVWKVVAFAAVAGLVVSLRHITIAISIATRAPKYESFLLAIGFEVGVVGIELANVTAPDVIRPELGYGLMALLAGVVALLNVFAFLSHMDPVPVREA